MAIETEATDTETLTVTLHGQPARRLREHARWSGRSPDEIMAGFAAEVGFAPDFERHADEEFERHREAFDRLADM